MPLPPALQNLSIKQKRIAAGAVGAVVLLAVLLFSMGEKPEVQHSFNQPEPAKAPNADMPADQSALILQLFNPSDQSLTNQLSSTVFSQQIEQALTVSFVLTKCGIITQDDYAETFRALLLYAQQTKLVADEAAANVKVRQLAESAGASYSLVYGRTSCTDAKLPILAKQLNDWVTTVFNR